MKSWFDLERKQQKKFEEEFFRKTGLKGIALISFIFFLIPSFIYLFYSFLEYYEYDNFFFDSENFTISLILFCISLIFFICISTYYSIKFNSWLKNSKSIIK